MSINYQKSCPLPVTSTITPVDIPTQNQLTLHPKASYEEVVEDERVFMETLKDLHQSLGSKLMVPTIGWKPLDMHRLFVEVTCRGGHQKVTREQKWKDVSCAFTFPSTTTSASFQLRKNYISLLQIYEQLYFFRKKDSKLSSKVDRSTEQPTMTVGQIVEGEIYGKYENGYIFRTNFGSKTLNGILYHNRLQQMEPQISPRAISCGRKRNRKETDPSTFKSSLGGYNMFFVEHYSKLRPLYSGKEKAIAKQISYLWNELTESEKEDYEERNKVRCKTGMSK